MDILFQSHFDDVIRIKQGQLHGIILRFSRSGYISDSFIIDYLYLTLFILIDYFVHHFLQDNRADGGQGLSLHIISG